MTKSERDQLIGRVQRLTLEWVGTVLGDTDVNLCDNFLDLGGHSVLALRLCGHARDTFGVEYDLMLLFESDLDVVAKDLALRIENYGQPGQGGTLS